MILLFLFSILSIFLEFLLYRNYILNVTNSNIQEEQKVLSEKLPIRFGFKNELNR